MLFNQFSKYVLNLKFLFGLNYRVENVANWKGVLGKSNFNLKFDYEVYGAGNWKR